MELKRAANAADKKALPLFYCVLGYNLHVLSTITSRIQTVITSYSAFRAADVFMNKDNTTPIPKRLGIGKLCKI